MTSLSLTEQSARFKGDYMAVSVGMEDTLNIVRIVTIMILSRQYDRGTLNSAFDTVDHDCMLSIL